MRGKPKRLSTPDWSRTAEQISISHDLPGLTLAAELFLALVDVQQMQLVRELVETRKKELVLAYRNLVAIFAGYKSSRNESGEHYVLPQPCVVLVVRRKWADGSREESAPQLLPSHLLTYGDQDGKRVLFAIHTDVQPAAWFSSSVARSKTAIRVEEDGTSFFDEGTITCAVQVQTDESQLQFGLSALHVLSPIPQLDTSPSSQASFRPVGSSQAVGSSTGWGGILRDIGISFDAQLADLKTGDWRKSAFAGLSLSAARPYIESPAELDGLAKTTRLLIVAPDNHSAHVGTERDPILAQFRLYVGPEHSISYLVRVDEGATSVSLRHEHLLLIEVLESCPLPEEGDSGCAVVTWWPDGSMTLAGMFIGSSTDGSRLACVIPSWELFKTANWLDLPSGTTKITPTFSDS